MSNYFYTNDISGYNRINIICYFLRKLYGTKKIVLYHVKVGAVNYFL